jgi:hypothetical protein
MRGADMANDLADDKDKDESEPDKATVTLPGTVEKIIPAVGNMVPEQAQINIEGAEDLYREVRIENTLQDAGGNEVSLKKGADVEVTIKADPDSVKPKTENAD